MWYIRMNIGNEAIASLMDVGCVATQQRRCNPLCRTLANKSLLNTNDIRILLNYIALQSRLFEAMRNAAGIPGKNMKPCLVIDVYCSDYRGQTRTMRYWGHFSFAGHWMRRKPKVEH